MGTMKTRSSGPRLRPVAVLIALAAFAIAPAAADAASRTGRYQVVFEHSKTARSSSALSAVLARTGVVKAGSGAPRLGIATVKGSLGELAALRRDPAVKAVSAEWKRDFRRTPNDPALSMPDTAFPNPGGAPLQWNLGRENFPAAWDMTTGDEAIVAVLDSGVDGSHPELAGKIQTADAFGTGTSPTTDQDGHGTHVSGLACAGTNNGIGVAGAGFNCRIAIVKIPNLTDEDIINGIDRAVGRGADAINMSFGGGGPNAGIDLAIDRAIAASVVPVAAASNDVDTDQGSPAAQLQPDNAPDINAGRGLVVTGADFFDQNADTGRGNQISIAAYGFFQSVTGAPGVVSTYPGNSTPREEREIILFPPAMLPPCGCRRSIGGDHALRLPPGHLDGNAAGDRGGRDDRRAEPGAVGPGEDPHHQADGAPYERLDAAARLGHPRRRAGRRRGPPGRSHRSELEGPRQEERQARPRQAHDQGAPALDAERPAGPLRAGRLRRRRCRRLPAEGQRQVQADSPSEPQQDGGHQPSGRHLPRLHARPRQGGEPRADA